MNISLTQSLILFLCLGGAANWPGMLSQQSAVRGQTTADPRVPISMQQSSWNGQPMNTAEMGTGAASGGPLLGPGNTGMVRGSHADTGMAMGGMSGMAGVTYQAGDFGNVLRVMNAERMQAEGELREDEDKVMKELAQQQVRQLRYFEMFFAQCFLHNYICLLHNYMLTT